VDTPDGCSYHPRCPLATEECRMEDPGYATPTDDHYAACFHYEDAPKAVPFDIEAHAPDEQEEWP
jgi:ABC-type antimicrobial peptide transport system ATPase subunit